ncbi:OppA family ABC transporter substrate-binding lipoprotein [Mesomycoplasma molare]|uniref:Lipoprotein n=1 Tax=Mesomycoplasma molare TaxID=171288 RepID=A0ABY5TUP8_9BACT|nr:hypothetical protein [Mesomycoplasma molare]UWD34378.1 hypothetical protein NX772_00925 [Mesomycoplasma molare]
MKKKRLLFGLGGISVSCLSVATLISCSQIQPHYDRQELSFISNIANSGQKKFDHDFTTKLSSITIENSYITTANLFATVTEGEPEFEAISNPNSSQKYEEKEYRIVKPSYSWTSLILAGTVFVTDENGTISEFDNDNHEIGYLAEGEKPSDSIVILSSNDPRSINSENFKKKLETATKIQIAIKKDIPWVKYNGEKSEYNVELKDFVYGWNRKLLFDTEYRHQKGGSSQIDEELIRLYSLSSGSNFDPSNHVSNDYLFKVFGIDKKNFPSEDKFIQKVEGKEESALTFNKLDSQKANFNELFQKILVDSTYFSPVPHKFIDKKNSESKTTVEGKEYGQFQETDDALKYAYYWYGKDYDNDALYASPYLPLNLSVDRTVYIRNNYYAETGWKAKEETAVKKITRRYNLYPDAVQFNNAQFNNYLEGTLSVLPYSNLSDSNKAIIYNDISQIHFRTSPDKGKLKGSLIRDLVPGARDLLKPGTDFNNGFAEKKYYFNDNYAKLAFGSSIEELAKGKAQLGKTLFSLKSLAFRTIIDSVWNTYSYIRENSKTAIPWISILSPDNKLGGSELNNKTAREEYENINTLFALNSNGEKFYSKTIEEERKQFLNNLSSKATQYQAPNIEVLKAELKKILDDFYKENNLDASKDKVEFSLSNRYRNEAAQKISSLDEVVKLLNSLDPRLKVNSQSKFENQDIWNVLILGLGNSQIGGWSNDYDGSGTIFDGLPQMDGNPIYLAIAHFASLNENDVLVKSFPEFKKYADKFKEAFEEQRLKNENDSYGWVEFAEWINATNSSDAHYQDIQYEYEYEKNSDGTPLNVDEEGNAVPKLDENNQKIYVFTGEGTEKKPVWSQKYKWVLNETTKKYEKQTVERKAIGGNKISLYISTPIFTDEKSTLKFKDETLVQTFEENGQKVQKVFSHSRNKWVNATKPYEFNEYSAIFNLNYQSSITNDQIIELAKELRVLSGFVPEIDLSTNSNVPSISIWNKKIEIPLTQENFINYGNISIKKGEK